MVGLAGKTRAPAARGNPGWLCNFQRFSNPIRAHSLNNSIARARASERHRIARARDLRKRPPRLPCLFFAGLPWGRRGRRPGDSIKTTIRRATCQTFPETKRPHFADLAAGSPAQLVSLLLGFSRPFRSVSYSCCHSFIIRAAT